MEKKGGLTEDAEFLRLIGGDAHAGDPGLLHEQQLVWAYRAFDSLGWVPQSAELAVVHRLVHSENLVEVQFLNDQYRMKVPEAQCMPADQRIPEYRPVWMAPGELVPSVDDAWVQERERQQWYQTRGLPIPDQYGFDDWAKKWKEFHGPVRWAMPAATQEALRNRSIPASEVTGAYGKHFYTRLYANNFWAGNEGAGERRGLAQKLRAKGGQPITDYTITVQKYIPLSGDTLVWKGNQKGDGGAWVPEGEQEKDSSSWISW